MMETFAGGRWNLYDFKVDLYQGLEGLLRAAEQHEDRLVPIRYEDLVVQPDAELERLCARLGMGFEPAMLHSFNAVRLSGLGDFTGSRDYDQVSQAPLEKWKAAFSNPPRQAWARRYLRWIGAERLARMGYALEELEAELDAVPTTSRGVVSDVARAFGGVLRPLVEPVQLGHKLASVRRDRTTRSLLEHP